MQIVRVRNPSKATFKAKFDGEDYVIPAGSESLVPFGAMVLWAGDPTARDINPRQRYRTQELTRLHTKWGAYENEQRWKDNRPKIEFFTMEGDRIWTVMDDPDGTHSNTLTPDSQANATLTAQLAAVQAQMDEIMGMVKSGKLVLADDIAGAQDQSQLDQLGASAEERAIGLDTDPSTLPPLTVHPDPSIPAPIVSEGSQPPFSKENAGDDDNGDDGDGDEGKGTDGPPVDTPQSVKVGKRSAGKG